MNMLAAMADTLEAARRVGLDNLTSDVPEADYPHLADMYERAQSLVSQPKLGRWLGWMQACVVIQSGGELTLEDMKAINMRHAD